ncbi:hypothetical protein CCR75_000830 [Bremia lactucae]|uniref:Uncharacterized protein n=1 Tax=Bremia lactucae TaxID=4779 RepID=A0A976FNT6_BRELC|nr:hypothetical protein CCR75_000830 [Bremia lactucae]
MERWTGKVTTDTDLLLPHLARSLAPPPRTKIKQLVVAQYGIHLQEHKKATEIIWKMLETYKRRQQRELSRQE